MRRDAPARVPLHPCDTAVHVCALCGCVRVQDAACSRSVRHEHAPSGDNPSNETRIARVASHASPGAEPAACQTIGLRVDPADCLRRGVGVVGVGRR